MDDVHLAIDAPTRHRFTGAEVNDSRIGLVKFNPEIAQHTLPEPRDIARRFKHQFR